MLKASQLQIDKSNSCISTSPWCKYWENIHDLLKPNQEGPCASIISDLFKPNSKLWDENKNSAQSDDSFKNEVSNIPINNANLDDAICWTHTPDADCTTKSA